jgi:RNA polymerase sigma factor (sigma-70 family)
MSSLNNLLEFYKDHYLEIDIIADERSLFVLAFIQKLEPIALRELAESIGWETSSVAEVCFTLKDAGVIVTDDRSIKRLVPNIRTSDAGRALLQAFFNRPLATPVDAVTVTAREIEILESIAYGMPSRTIDLAMDEARRQKRANRVSGVAVQSSRIALANLEASDESTIVGEIDDLAEKVKMGDKKAAEAIYIELFPWLTKKMLRSYLNYLDAYERAEDIAQATLAKVIPEKIQQWSRSQGRFRLWVLHIANDLAMDEARRQKRANRVSRVAVQPDRISVANREDPAEPLIVGGEAGARRILEGLFRRAGLTGPQREALLLTYLTDMSISQIAQQLKVGRSTIYRRIRNARKRIARVIENDPATAK